MKRGRVLLLGDEEPASRRFAAVAFVAALLGYGAFLRGVMASGQVSSLVAWIAIAAAVLAPIANEIGAVRMRRFFGFDPPSELAVTGAAFASVPVLLIMVPAAALGAALCAAQGHLLVARRNDAAAAWIPGVSVVQALAGLALFPDAAGATFVPVVLFAAVAAQLLLAARVTRRDVASRSLGDAPTAETEAGAARRIIYGLPLAVVLALVALVISPFVSSPPWEWAEAATADTASERRAARRRAARESAGGSDAAAMEFNSEIALSGVPMPAYEILMEVVPKERGRPLGNIGPLYLRGVVLSQLTAGGARMRGAQAPTRRRDEDDGTQDGWVRVRDPAGTRTVQYEISHYPLPIEPQGWNLLFTVEPLFGIHADPVRYDPDRLLVATFVPQDWFTYTIEGPHPNALRHGSLGATSTYIDDRELQLPPPSPGLERLSAEAQRLTAGAASGVEAARSIVEHFQLGYEYSLEETEFPGIDGLVELLERRSGFCTQFSTAAVVMLRSVGIPSRVVTGFFATEWSDEQQAYQIRPRDTHAWIEVHVDDVGWVRFDPTPADTRRRAIDALDGSSAGVRAWAGGLLDRIGNLVTGSENARISDVVAALRDTPGAILRGALLVVSVLVLAAVLRRVFGGTATTGVGAPRTREQRELEDAYERILAALSRRGYRKREASTPREFAATVVNAGGVAYRALAPITERIYAARFGGRPLDDAARRRIDEFVTSLA